MTHELDTLVFPQKANQQLDHFPRAILYAMQHWTYIIQYALFQPSSFWMYDAVSVWITNEVRAKTSIRAARVTREYLIPVCSFLLIERPVVRKMELIHSITSTLTQEVVSGGLMAHTDHSRAAQYHEIFRLHWNLAMDPKGPPLQTLDSRQEAYWF